MYFCVLASYFLVYVNKSESLLQRGWNQHFLQGLTVFRNALIVPIILDGHFAFSIIKCSPSNLSCTFLFNWSSVENRQGGSVVLPQGTPGVNSSPIDMLPNPSQANSMNSNAQMRTPPSLTGFLPLTVSSTSFTI